jgi:hypothetical protein
VKPGARRPGLFGEGVGDGEGDGSGTRPEDSGAGAPPRPVSPARLSDARDRVTT